jgi:phosphoglycerate-specific signal transduction histidine kinase
MGTMDNQGSIRDEIGQLREKLKQKDQEIEYYKRISEAAGKRYLSNINMLSESLEKQKILSLKLEKAYRKIKTAMEEVKVLRGLIPICSKCKHIRDDKGLWFQVEEYIRSHSEAKFTHSICPKCSSELIKEIDIYKKGKRDKK